MSIKSKNNMKVSRDRARRSGGQDQRSRVRGLAHESSLVPSMSDSSFLPKPKLSCPILIVVSTADAGQNSTSRKLEHFSLPSTQPGPLFEEAGDPETLERNETPRTAHLMLVLVTPVARSSGGLSGTLSGSIPGASSSRRPP